MRGPRALALLGALAGLACARVEPPLPSASTSLADLAPRGRALRETRSLDFGDASARPYLWSGWGFDENGPDGTFVWGAGERSVLRVDIAEPRDLRLRLRGWSMAFGDAPAQQVEVSVNGREVGRRFVPTRPTVLDFDVPREAWRAGENRVKLAYARHNRRVGERPWAVAWDVLRLGDNGAQPPEPPAFDPDGRLVLPASTAFEWTLELPGDAWLAWNGLEARAGARLVVEVEEEGGDEVERARFGPGGGRARLSRDGDPHRLRRLLLRSEPVGAGGGVVLAGARLHVPGGLPVRAAPPFAAVAREAVPTAAADAVPAALPAAAPIRPAPPNLLVYVIDTLRADHLGCYGYPVPTSPEIDDFARTAVRFLDGRAQSSWTRPAMASLLTGLLPVAHQAEDDVDQLPERVETVAEQLAAAGYQTAMITTNGNVAGRFGFRQGFEHFEYLQERRNAPEVHVQSDEVNRRVFSWLAGRDRTRPFFLFVHTTDPHDPYTPRRRFRDRLARQVADPSVGSLDSIRALIGLEGEAGERRAAELVPLYDAEIAANDHAFGALVARLDRSGAGERTAVFLTSDHGEEFFEHGGWTHGKTLYEEQLRIPFLVRLPGGEAAGRTIAEPAEQIDLAPTLLELAGVAPPALLDGHSLLPAIRAERPAASLPSLAFLSRGDYRSASLVLSEWKLLRSIRSEAVVMLPPVELFALGSDPGELDNQADERRLRRLWLEGELAAAEARRRSPLPKAKAVLSPELTARLRALGYLR